jgi:hypothetical protein
MVIEIAALLIGTLCVFLGYKLLMRGVYPDTHATIVWSDRSLLIKRGAPGVVFVLIGVVMIGAPLLHLSELRKREAPPSAEEEQTQTSTQPAATQKPKRKHAREQGSRQRVAPAQAETDRKNGVERGESSPDDSNQPPPKKIWKPGRA